MIYHSNIGINDAAVARPFPIFPHTLGFFYIGCQTGLLELNGLDGDLPLNRLVAPCFNIPIALGTIPDLTTASLAVCNTVFPAYFRTEDI